MTSSPGVKIVVQPKQRSCSFFDFRCFLAIALLLILLNLIVFAPPFFKSNKRDSLSSNNNNAHEVFPKKNSPLIVVSDSLPDVIEEEQKLPRVVVRKTSPKKIPSRSHTNQSEINLKLEPSAHMCFSRDHSAEAAKHAACQYRMLCAVSSKTTEKGEWFYLSDRKESFLDFSTGIGPHHVDDRVFFTVNSISLDEFKTLHPKARIEAKPHFLFSEYNAENYGHFLTDLLFPIYTVLDGFDAVSTDIQLLHHRPKDPIGWSCDFQATLPDAGTRQRNCERFYSNLIPMLSEHKVKDLTTVLGPPGDAVCFNQIYVGASRFSAFCFDGGDSRGMKEGDPRYPNMPCYNGRQKQLWDFRVYTKANLGIPDILPSKHQVVIWDRRDKRSFDGLDTLASKIEQTFNVTAILITDWSKYTIKEQIAMMGITTVHITGVGGGSFVALHLPRGATTIRLSRPGDSFMESWVFDFVGYVHPVYHTTDKNPVEVDVLLGHVSAGLKRYEAFGLPFGS